jgi:hypothetical protein
MHQEQLGIVARGRIGTAFDLRVLRVGEHRRPVSDELGGVAESTGLRPVVVEPESFEATRLDVDLIDELRPGLTRHGLGDGSCDLPLGAAIAELGVGRNDVSIIVGRLEDRRPALFEF